MPPNVVLIGFMGTGKTAVGREVAARLHRPFVDTDALIEERAGRPIPRIFTEDGEEAFRRLEAAIVEAVSGGEGAVIATGGGAVLRRENMDRLRRNGLIVALRADPAAIRSRVGPGGERPLLGSDPDTAIRRLLAAREALYREADLTVDTSALSLDEVVARVVSFVAARNGRAEPAPESTQRVVRVAAGARGYDVHIGRGLLPHASRYLRGCGLAGRLALLTHPRLNAVYGRPLVASLREARYETVTITVPASESSKSLRAAARVYDALVRAEVDRTGALLTLGGGVAGDLGGFVAATYLRGIAWVGIPTTLLAQVDASIGGKTAVNHPRAKNIIGAFHQPSLVLADIDTLRSLPRREVRSGMAEVIKTGIIGAPDLIEYLGAHLADVLALRPEALARVVSRCADYKAGVVSGDERETAGRIALNYGHTFGHAIEAAVGYRGITHGEAVAVGMTLEARLATELGICGPALLERQTGLLRAAGLPVRMAELRLRRRPARAAVVAAMAHDKKALGGRLRFVLPTALGETVVRDDIPARLVEEVLAGG